jgi:uncharacterized membrane protein YjdF
MCVLFVNEVSTIFLNIRFLLLHFNASSSPLYFYNGLVLASTFFVARIVTISVMVAHVAYSWFSLAFQQGLYWSRPPSDRIIFGGLTALLVAHWAINIFWFRKILSSSRRAVAKRAATEQKSR